MTNVHSKKQRSHNMSCIKRSKTKPELKIKKIMTCLGFVYQPKNILGHPDYADRKNKIAVFIDGCFWHKCLKHFVKPFSNKSFWEKKIANNVSRDKEVNTKLKKEGWRVIRIWEHDLTGRFYKSRSIQ